jgi:predicted membrane protein
MPEIEGLIPAIVGIAVICLVVMFFGWFFTHPVIFIPVGLLITFLIYRARGRRRV